MPHNHAENLNAKSLTSAVIYHGRSARITYPAKPGRSRLPGLVLCARHNTA